LNLQPDKIDHDESFIDHYVNIQGYKTRYWDVGFSDSVVLFVHGFSLSCEVWQQNIRELAKSHRVIALDFWGCGKTDATAKKFDIAEYPKFLIRFMDALKIPKAKIVAHSIGGLMALKLAQSYKEYVEKLVLVCSAGFTKSVPLHFRLFSVPLLGEYISKPSLKMMRHAFSYNVHAQKNFPDNYVNALYQHTKKPFSSEHLVNMARVGIGLFGFRQHIVREVKTEAKNIQCPVLIVWGKNDRILSYRGALAAQKLIPGAKLEMIKNCGHLPQIEHTDYFNTVLHSFL